MKLDHLSAKWVSTVKNMHTATTLQNQVKSTMHVACGSPWSPWMPGIPDQYTAKADFFYS